MLVEVIDYNGINAEDDEPDAGLVFLEKDLREALRAEDVDLAKALAREVRRYLLANEYADEDELPTETA
jgi:hypothetical protein